MTYDESSKTSLLWVFSTLHSLDHVMHPEQANAGDDPHKHPATRPQTGVVE